MIIGELILPSIRGREIAPGIFAVSEPVPRPDLGDNRMACLADVYGALCVVELSIVIKKGSNDVESCTVS